MIDKYENIWNLARPYQSAAASVAVGELSAALSQDKFNLIVDQRRVQFALKRCITGNAGGCVGDACLQYTRRNEEHV